MNDLPTTVELLRQSVKAASLVIAKLDRLASDPRLAMPLSLESLASLPEDDEARLHGFLRLFEQLHQLIERRLFRGILALSDIESAALSVRNMVDRLEKLGAIESGDEWRALSIVRNNLAHDYPNNFSIFAERVNETFSAFSALRHFALLALNYIDREKLLD